MAGSHGLLAILFQCSWVHLPYAKPHSKLAHVGASR
jgi:hypothetical protein